MYATNSAYASAGNAYRKNEVMTASKKKLVILLYEGAARNLKLAKLAMGDKDIEKTNRSIQKAQDILAELMSTLNFEVGGDIARNLLSLYQYMYQKTVSANVAKDPHPLDEVIGYLDELRDTWSQL